MIPRGLISIILPTYNSEIHVNECLESILENTDANIEIIVVDRLSKDRTLSIIEEFKNNKVFVVSEYDTGIYDALNKGVQRARGEWLYFLGVDDRLLPGFKKLASKLCKKNTIYYGDPEFTSRDVDWNQSFYTGKFSKYKLIKDSINHQAIIYPRLAFDDYCYKLNYNVHADYYLNLELWGNKKFKRKHFPISIVKYNITGFSSKTPDPEFKKNKPHIIRLTLGIFYYILYLLYRKRKHRSGFTDYY